MKHARMSCKGCRLSKVKCDVEASPHGTCTRCVRLSLHCVPNAPSQRGRKSQRAAVSRMKPAVRALLKEHGGAGQSPGSGEDNEVELLEAFMNDHEVGAPSGDPSGGALNISWSGQQVAPLCTAVRDSPLDVALHWRLHIDAMNDLGLHYVKMQFLESTFAHARRKASWQLTTEAMRIASHLCVPLDETVRLMDKVNTLTALPVPNSIDMRLPDYIAEWHERPIPCLTRIEVAGVVCYRPNRALLDGWAALVGTSQHIEAMCGSDDQPDILHALDSAWLSLFPFAEDLHEIVQLTMRVLMQIRPDAKTTQHVQARTDRKVRLCLGGRCYGEHAVLVRAMVLNGGADRYESTVLEGFPSLQAIEYATDPGALVAFSRPRSSAGSDGGEASLPGSAGMTAGRNPGTTCAAAAHQTQSGPAIGDEELARLADTIPLEQLISSLTAEPC